MERVDVPDDDRDDSCTECLGTGIGVTPDHACLRCRGSGFEPVALGDEDGDLDHLDDDLGDEDYLAEQAEDRHFGGRRE